MKNYFFPHDHYDRKFRGMLFPLLKPFIKNAGFTDEERIKLYNISERDVNFVDSLKDSDAVILTMAWNYYYKNDHLSKATQLIKQAEKFNKKVLVYMAGDSGIKMPEFKNVLIFRFAAKRSNPKENEIIIPPFIADPIKEVYNEDKISVKRYSLIPEIGFCGQANSSRFKAFKEIFSRALKNLKYHLHFGHEEPDAIISTSFFRFKVLERLSNSQDLNSDFILRKQYRAGVKRLKEFESSTKEFYDNIRDTHYTVCMRGAGNFSIRLYETLAMGRIPIFINTNGVLPLEDSINWKNHLVWIESNELDSINEKIIEFHLSLKNGEFLKVQNSNRLLWENKLTLKGYFNSLPI